MGGKLDHLKIKRAPAAFAQWARNFNAQIDLLASIQGGPGIDVQVAHSPRKVVSPKGVPRPKEQPRGKILLTLRPSAITGIGVGSGGGNANTNTVNVNVVTSVGTLAQIAVPNASFLLTYPTTLGVANPGATNVTINAIGIEVTNASGIAPTRRSFIANDRIRSSSTTNAAFSEMQPGYVGVDNNGNGAALDVAGGIMYLAYRNSGAIAATIPLADLTRNMSIKTISVCNGNVVQSMLIIASDPF